jgi:hypothetical protein
MRPDPHRSRRRAPRERIGLGCPAGLASRVETGPIMKKIIIRSLIAVALLAVVAVFALILSLDRIVKTGVETVGPVLTKTTVKLDKAQFRLMAGRLNLEGLVVGNPEGFKTPSAFQVGQITLQVKPGSVFSDVVEIDELTLKSPEITYEHRGLTDSNIKTLLDTVTASSGKPAEKTPTAQAPAGTIKRFRVKLINIEGAKVNVSATLLGGGAASLSLPSLKLENIGTSGDGVTAGELTKEILGKILKSVTEVVTKSLISGDATTGMGKEADKVLNKATEGVKNLFKK